MWLVKLPEYKAVVSQASGRDQLRLQEDSALLADSSDDPDEHIHHKSDEKDHVVRIAKTNVIFNVAVAYVFVVTLVREPFSTIRSISTYATI